MATLGDAVHDFGPHFIVGLDGLSLSERDKRVLGTLKPAGVLLLARNFDDKGTYDGWLSKLRSLIAEIREYSEQDNPLITLDHEGGSIVRTPPPITRFPFAIEYARRAKDVATAMSVELASLGVNLSWAPCADVHWNPNNPVIGKRAFATSADKVAEYATDFMKTMDKCGLLTCAKHFPGHGGTSTDSHYELPVLECTEAEYAARDLLPFAELIAAGVPTIMTAHVMLPKIDKLYPATLSPKIQRDILRTQLGFKGVLVGDDLDMKAVSDLFKGTDALKVAFEATCDIFIVAKETERAVHLAKEAGKMLSSRHIKENVIAESRGRIAALMKRAKKNEVTKLSDDVLEKHRVLAQECKE